MRFFPVIAVLGCVAAMAQCPPPGPPAGFPSYCTATVLNSADSLPNVFSPNTIASVYGHNLSTVTVALTATDVSITGMMPTRLPGTDTHVLMGGMEAIPLYIAPSQINFLIPSNLLPGMTTFTVVSEGREGPALAMDLLVTAPALFLLDEQTAVATHADGSVITDTKPASPGEIVILYATGLGPVNPPIVTGQLPTAAARLIPESNFQIMLDGLPVPPEDVQYAGIAPFYAGLYQINVQLPEGTSENPEIRVACGGQISPPLIRLNVQK